jgi:hypothetical protein
VTSASLDVDVTQIHAGTGQLDELMPWLALEDAKLSPDIGKGVESEL